MFKVYAPPGDYYCIKPPGLSESVLEASWDLDPGMEAIDGISARHCGLGAVVTTASPRQLREAVECHAYYFRREFGYTIVQYSSLETGDDGHRAYLWTDPTCLNDGKQTVCGACCFRFRRWSNAPKDFPDESYALQWIWLHPYLRRKGLLTKAWPYFLKRFHPFVPEGPFSPAMEAFLRKQKYDGFLPPAD
jgi:hypothetical protein